MPADSSNKTAPGDGSVDPVSATIQFWSQWMEQSSRGTQALLEVIQSVGDPGTLQKRWTDTMAQTADSFMRTPEFLEMMRRHLKAITDLKTVQNEVVQATARELGVPLVGDISSVLERVKSAERKILDRLQSIEDRLTAIEANGAKTRTARGKAGESHQE
jgi:hypothetical protein